MNNEKQREFNIIRRAIEHGYEINANDRWADIVTDAKEYHCGAGGGTLSVS